MENQYDLVLVFASIFAVLLIFVTVYSVSLYREYNKIKEKLQGSITFEPHEIELLCKSISDSMNYKKGYLHAEKFNLLLKCTRYKLDINEKRKRK